MPDTVLRVLLTVVFFLFMVRNLFSLSLLALDILKQPDQVFIDTVYIHVAVNDVNGCTCIFLALLLPRHVNAYLSHAKSGISMLAPELLKQYIQDGKLTPEGPNRILLPSSPDLKIPSPHTLITASTSTCAHYLLSENEPVSLRH